MVSHSLSVSESVSSQLECHLGFHWVNPLIVGWFSMTSPQVLQTFSPVIPSGDTLVPLQSGQFVVLHFSLSLFNLVE